MRPEKTVTQDAWRVDGPVVDAVPYARTELEARTILLHHGVIRQEETLVDMSGRAGLCLYFETEEQAHAFLDRFGQYLLAVEDWRLNMDRLHDRWEYVPRPYGHADPDA